MRKLLIAVASWFLCAACAGAWMTVGRPQESRAGITGSRKPPSRMYKEIKLDERSLYRLPPLDPRTVRSGKGKSGRLQTGVVRALSPDTATNVRWFDLGEKGHAALSGIVSPGARQVRVHFADVRLDSRAQLFVRSMKNRDEFYGPFEGRGASPDGSFWTPPVEGEGVVVEYFNPRPLKRGETSKLPFQIVEINHVFRD